MDKGGIIMHECVIGIWYYDEGAELYTVDDLKRLVKDFKERATRLREAVCFEEAEKYDAIANAYFDNQEDTDFKDTYFEHFDYCPYCGKKIDWKGLRENANCK